MIKIENVEVVGVESAIRGMRNPMNSWDKSDSGYCEEYYCEEDKCPWFNHYNCNNYEHGDLILGNADRKLANKLVDAGSAHAKFKRMINVYLDVTSNHTWWAEFDTYEHTVRNSCSKMHKIHVKEITKDDFSHEGVDEVGGKTVEVFEEYLAHLEWLRTKFNETQEKKYWRALIDMLPMGYNLRATIMLNYEVLTAIYRWRRHHKMFEWEVFCKWIESLPNSELITGGIDNGN